MLLSKRISISYFLKLIAYDVIAILTYSCLVGALDLFSYFKDMSIPLAAAGFIATLLSLLLAFRTAQSYERWWEARTVWGAIVNDSRTLIRQVLQFLPNDDRKSTYVKEFATRQSMWCYALADSLRRVPLSKHVEDYKLAYVLQSDNLPNLLLSKHAEELACVSEHYQLNSNKQVQIDSTLQRLTDSMGKCERIKNTVFPRSYSILIHFLIYVLMTILPFGLDDNQPLLEIALTTLIPVLFIAIERTAILMQDPFENKPTDTPMTTLSGTIERNLMEMIGAEKPDREMNNGNYYVM